MQKEEISTTILAVRPGRREMGVAVFEGKELVYWSVIGFRKTAPDELASHIKRRLSALIETYRPHTLACEQPTPVRLKASPELGRITASVSTAAIGASLYFQIYKPSTVRRKLCGSSRAPRQQMVQKIINLYPHLGRYLDAPSRWQKEYWMPMFTAVAVGLACR